MPLVLFLGGKFDLLFGFNQTHAGFTVLLSLCVVVPILDLLWFITEIIFSIKRAGQRKRVSIILMPCIALFFFIESIAIDLYLLSYMRM